MNRNPNQSAFKHENVLNLSSNPNIFSSAGRRVLEQINLETIQTVGSSTKENACALGAGLYSYPCEDCFIELKDFPKHLEHRLNRLFRSLALYKRYSVASNYTIRSYLKCYKVLKYYSQKDKTYIFKKSFDDQMKIIISRKF